MPNVTRYHPLLVALHWVLALGIAVSPFSFTNLSKKRAYSAECGSAGGQPKTQLLMGETIGPAPIRPYNLID